MKSEIHITNRAEECLVEIEGTIGLPEEWQSAGSSERISTYGRFRDALARLRAIDARRVVVEIRSTGGDVNDALLIYEALRSLGVPVTTRCFGYTASAATVIAQAADPGCREIARSALYLIHNASCAAEGNVARLEERLELLRKTDERLADLYAARSGRPREEMAALMARNRGEGCWLSPEEAVAAGLADRIVEAPDRRESLTRQVAARWSGLMTRLGLRREERPSDHNILHLTADGLPAAEADVEAAAEELRRDVRPTATRPREDPAALDAGRTPNDSAYAEDVRRFYKL